MKYAIIAACIVVLILAPGAFAYSNLEMVITPSYVSVCPCSAASNINLMLTNLDDETDTYKLRLGLPSGWSGFIEPEVTLASGESRSVSIYVTPDCVSEPAVYIVKVIATSSLTGEVFSKDLKVEVLRCHHVKLYVEPQISMCKGESIDYGIDVKNMGKFDEEFNVNIATPWGQHITHTIKLLSQQTKRIVVKLTPPADKTGEYYIEVDANSLTSYASDTAVSELTIENCYDFDAYLSPFSQDVCLGRLARFDLVIVNKGTKDDNYTISMPSWVISDKESVYLKGGRQGNVKIYVKPRVAFEKEFDITIASSKKPGLRYVVKGKVSARDCRKVAVIITPADSEVCYGLEKVYDVIIKNTGTIEETYNIVSTHGKLSQSKVFLNPGETKKVKLTVGAEEMELGKVMVIVVKAFAKGIADENIATLAVKNCYSAEMSVEPEYKKACRKEVINYSINVKNTGRFTDSYTLYMDNKEIAKFILRSGEETVFTKSLYLFQPYAQTKEITFKLNSSFVAVEKHVKVDIRPIEECYSVEINIEGNGKRVKVIGMPTGAGVATGFIKERAAKVNVDVCKTAVLNVRIRNIGEMSDVYNVAIEGPEWVYISQQKFLLKKGEAKNAYIYISPPYNVKGSYVAKLIVSSENIKKVVEILINVNQWDACVIEGREVNITTPAQPKENVTNISGIEVPTRNVTANISNETITGAVPVKIGLKSILAVVIIISIVCILAAKIIMVVK
ncbi:MAG TPA: hypothetical protein ENG42_03175 [Candidatus Aenigmarchaeota archaeon]|nr:MAG: hypothetical protein DRP03_00995 [Candidatus Aenigmarchaeota archaeon]HDD46453.1 hypothetical protein [Candidatus Aenigmarchaeota archaeon]